MIVKRSILNCDFDFSNNNNNGFLYKVVKMKQVFKIIWEQLIWNWFFSLFKTGWYRKNVGGNVEAHLYGLCLTTPLSQTSKEWTITPEEENVPVIQARSRFLVMILKTINNFLTQYLFDSTVWACTWLPDNWSQYFQHSAQFKESLLNDRVGFLPEAHVLPTLSQPCPCKTNMTQPNPNTC